MDTGCSRMDKSTLLRIKNLGKSFRHLMEKQGRMN